MSIDMNQNENILKEIEDLKRRVKALEPLQSKGGKNQSKTESRLKIGRQKELRGDILNERYEILGEEVSVKVLKILVGRKPSDDSGEIEKGLEYLVKKGYVQRAKCGACVVISATGIDICEGDFSDAGVIL
ncbi:hypothetical protein FACS1894188_11940 [Clostridia bacterium]|nr:hypothetical protein FACS1894188_11940 [Clostridia bacterium]